MDRQRTRRVLIVAFALSLLVHLIWAANVQWRIPPDDDTQQAEIFHVAKLPVARVIHTPPPTPPPTPAPAPHPAVSVAPAKIKGLSKFGSGGTAHVAVAPKPAPSVTPAVASPTPNCGKLDFPASIAESPPPSDISPAVRGEATSGTTRVRVEIDANGNITGAAVLSSSGNSSLDVVAVTMAKDARYNPATHQCKAVASYYDFTAKFEPW